VPLSPTTTLHLKDPDAFRALIKSRGLTFRKLAERVEIHPSRVGQLCEGHRPDTAGATALALAAELDVDVAVLFDFPDGQTLVDLGLISAGS
jgi:transcriptional regulator with XRE-family HTH domain